jgi:hypothetical protein
VAFKFWKRLFRRRESERRRDAEASSVSSARSAALCFPLFPNSNREVVALQRVVGNQVVLQLLERRRLAASASLARARTQPKQSLWWRCASSEKKELA